MRWELDLHRTAPPLSLNARLHWAAQKRIKDKLQADVYFLLKAAKVPAMDQCRVWLQWQPAVKRRRDTDNCELTRKACVDQLVRSGLIEDDTPEFVQRPENVILPVQRGVGKLTLVIENRFKGAE